MNKPPVLELARDVPDTTLAILDRLPNVTVRKHRPSSRLAFNGSSVPVVLVSGGGTVAKETLGLLAPLAAAGRLGMVVATRLPGRVRRELEAAGCAYADGTGAVHIDVPGLLIHVEGATRSVAPARLPAGLGVVGVRVVQVLLTEVERDWSVTDLAAAAASSAGEAHKILTRLESEGLLTVIGQGPARRRRVVKPDELLDWLAAVPAARRLRERLLAFAYAPTPDALLSRLATHAFDAGLEYAVTGTAGAVALGAKVTTAMPQAMVRIDPDVDLAAAAKQLRAEPVEGGANLLLVRDLGRLGLHGRVASDSVAVAQPVRLWLDMLGEPRGEDAAAIFRETFLGW